jgi:hypothetical protein
MVDMFFICRIKTKRGHFAEGLTLIIWSIYKIKKGVVSKEKIFFNNSSQSETIIVHRSHVFAGSRRNEESQWKDS